MIITCPHCQTRYEVAKEAIGAEGRQVQCAHCMKAWLANAAAAAEAAPKLREVPHLREVPNIRDMPRSEPQPLDAAAEARLDVALEAEQKAVEIAERVIAEARQRRLDAPPPSKAEKIEEQQRQKAFSRRQLSTIKQLPMSKTRRSIRWGATAALTVVLVGLVAMRVDIVRQMPDMAGIYAAIGMPVNVIGLEFGEVTTETSLSNGKLVLTVNSRIRSASNRIVPIPPVVVTLLDHNGTALYAWSVTPDAEDLGPGETVAFETQLMTPPDGATRVKLTFAGNRVQSDMLATSVPVVETLHEATPEDTEPHAEPVDDEPVPAELLHAEPAVSKGETH